MVRPEVHTDLQEAAAWYDSQRAGLGHELITEVARVFPELAANPLLNSRRHRMKHLSNEVPVTFCAPQETDSDTIS